ncbi:MAG: 4Fe-4S binding protein [Elusimicrobiota bacterium]
MKNTTKITIDADRCKGCGLCIIYCTKKVLAKSKTLNKIGYNSITVENPDKCNSCGTCYITCPDYAIEIK